MNLLFVCSRNQWRSPTAENIYKLNQEFNVRSAGTEPSARIKLSEKMVIWADVIFVMEKKHKQRIMEKFGSTADAEKIVILDIPDEYQFMDEELIEEITTKVDYYLNC
ncbi:MAG: protein tyrosine phosphatase [Sphingobacteriales bacterium]|nr:MAG: protein tyrosine phosphatase [Sphingobacteriales bacterium]